MNTIKHNWPEIFGVCFVAACTAFAIVGWPKWVWPKWAESDPAAYVQAIGSVAAIFVAIALFWFERLFARRDIRAKEERQEIVLLTTIHDDLCLCKVGLIDVVYVELQKCAEKQGLYLQMDVPDESLMQRFLVERADVIRDRDLCREVLHVYSGISSLSGLIRSNTAMVQNLNRLIESALAGDGRNSTQQYQYTLDAMLDAIDLKGEVLKQRVHDVGSAVAELIVRIQPNIKI